MKYLTNSGLSYFLNKIKAYLTSSTYLNSIGISNSEIDNIADDAGYSSGSLPASEDIFITGDIIPNTDNSVDLGTSSKNFKMIYTKGITINGTQFLPSDYIPKAGGNVITGTTFNRTVNDSSVTLCGGTGWDYGASITLSGKDRTNDNGDVIIRTKDNSNVSDLVLRPNGTATWSNKNLAMQEDVIPRSCGSVMTSSWLGRTTSDSEFRIDGGNGWGKGGSVLCYGENRTGNNGGVLLHPAISSVYKFMALNPNGTWTWDGTPCQVTSDQRLKQQIAEIDDKLLDAWEDVNLVQFKYNDAVKEKSDNARLHTGYVVQQIDDACKSHNVDISAYGLYCHEEYPEETEEVEVEQEDGTKVKETKVIREASEHYSLRYTEVYAVECAYLRKRIKELEERLEKLEGNSK